VASHQKKGPPSLRKKRIRRRGEKSRCGRLFRRGFEFFSTVGSDTLVKRKRGKGVSQKKGNDANVIKKRQIVFFTKQKKEMLGENLRRDHHQK